MGDSVLRLYIGIWCFERSLIRGRQLLDFRVCHRLPKNFMQATPDFFDSIDSYLFSKVAAQ